MRKTWPLTDIYPSYTLPNPRPPWNVACHTKIRCKTNEQTKWRIEIYSEQAANSRQWSGNLGETVFLLLAFGKCSMLASKWLFTRWIQATTALKILAIWKLVKAWGPRRVRVKYIRRQMEGAAECSSFRFSVRRTPWIALVCYRLKVDPERSEFNFF